MSRVNLLSALGALAILVVAALFLSQSEPGSSTSAQSPAVNGTSGSAGSITTEAKKKAVLRGLGMA